MTVRQFARIAAASALACAALGVSGCVLIDEDAELDQRVMESPDIDTARESNYPRQSSNPNPRDID